MREFCMATHHSRVDGKCLCHHPLINVLSYELTLEGQCLCLINHTLVDRWRLSVHDHMTLTVDKEERERERPQKACYMHAVHSHVPSH